MAADTTPVEWTDEEWTDNLQRVFSILSVARDMKAPDVADAMPMPRSTFYDKLKKGTFTANEIRHMAKALDVPPIVFYEPATGLFSDQFTSGSFAPSLFALPDPTGQGHLLADDLAPFDFYSRAELATV